MNEQQAARVSFAINRLDNLLKAKYTFIERMRAAKNLSNDAWQRQFTQNLIDTTQAEILEIATAIHDLRTARES